MAEERELAGGEGGGEGGGGEGETLQTRQMNVFRNYLRGGTVEQYITEMRALQMDNPAQAGYLVAPEQFGSTLIADMNNALFMRQKATTYTLRGAMSLGFPKRTARANAAKWGAEISTPPEDTALAFGKREFKPNYISVLEKVSRPLLLNSTLDPERIVIDELTFDMNETQEQAYMTGDGNAKPLGIFVASNDGISTARDTKCAANNAIDLDALYDTKYALKAQYRNGCEWIMHRDIIKAISKMKDGAGNYIWQVSLQAGQPDRLLSYPINESEYAPNTIAANQYVAVLGNFKWYWIVDSLFVELQRLNELYAESNRVGFILRAQTDGMPVLEEAFSRLQMNS